MKLSERIQTVIEKNTSITSQGITLSEEILKSWLDEIKIMENRLMGLEYTPTPFISPQGFDIEEFRREWSSVNDRPILSDGDKRPDTDRPIFISCDPAKEDTDVSVVSRIINGRHTEVVIVDEYKEKKETTASITDFYLEHMPTITEPTIERESFKRNKAGQMPSKFGKGKRR